MTTNEFLVIGAGLAGSTAARLLADNGNHVTVIDRRDHIAGNLYDYRDEYGILIHKYGPHTFHTNDQKIEEFVRRFEAWCPFKLTCGTYIQDKHIQMPFNFTSIDELFDEDTAVKLKTELIRIYQGRDTNIVDMLKSDNVLIQEYAKFLFDNDFKLYTAKQWGISAEQVDPNVLKRVPIRVSYDDHYLGDKFEAMPKLSFTHMVQNMLASNNIDIKLNEDFMYDNALKCKESGISVIFTGPIDRLYSYKYGRLPYRSLEFEYHHDDISEYQKYPVEAYPADPLITRIVEYNKLTNNPSGAGVTYISERSVASDDAHEPYYPVRSSETDTLYEKYRTELKNEFPNIKLCGRLALYKYLNMDQTIQTAFDCINM